MSNDEILELFSAVSDILQNQVAILSCLTWLMPAAYKMYGDEIDKEKFKSCFDGLVTQVNDVYERYKAGDDE